MRVGVGVGVTVLVAGLLVGCTSSEQGSGAPSPNRSASVESTSNDSDDLAAKAKKVAPVVWLAKEEEHLPADASVFVDESELRFDSGRCGREVVSPDPTEVGLADGEYTAYANVKKGTGQHDTCVEDKTVQYATNGSDKYQNGQGFYLDVNDDARHGVGPDAPSYWQYLGDKETGDGAFLYWLFYAYNDFANNHEADWERVAVKVDNWRPVGMVFKRHNEPTCLVDSADMQTRDGRLVAYAAKGSHGSYSYGGTFDVNGFVDTTSQGELWRTGAALKATKEQPWWGYRGMWGAVKDVPGFTGIAGPGPDREEAVTNDSLTTTLCEPVDDTIPNTFVGKWKSDGPATQVPAGPSGDWNIQLEIFKVANGAAYGVVFYPELQCDGQFTLIDRTDTELRLQETIKSDPSDRCGDIGVVTLSPTTGGLTYTYEKPESDDPTMATAKLIPA